MMRLRAVLQMADAEIPQLAVNRRHSSEIFNDARECGVEMPGERVQIGGKERAQLRMALEQDLVEAARHRDPVGTESFEVLLDAINGFLGHASTSSTDRVSGAVTPARKLSRGYSPSQ
jgi:hypothetical protein